MLVAIALRAALSCACALCVLLTLFVVAVRVRRVVSSSRANRVRIGFFHPYCNAGGGGERVLWCAVRATQNKYDRAECIVYTGDAASGEDILRKAQHSFGIVLPQPVTFVHLSLRGWVEASRYPVLTLLGQSMGSILLGLEALVKTVPDVYIDTMGYAFTLPIFGFIGGCNVGCYVHYPTISTDMLELVKERRATYNNAGVVARSRTLSAAKLGYYRFFAATYGFVGRASTSVMVNSTWTRNHIDSIWRIPARTAVVYPPCDTRSLQEIPLEGRPYNVNGASVPSGAALSARGHKIVSVAQFRPEKNHVLQLRALALLLKERPSLRVTVLLVFVGGCRGADDEARVASLRALAVELGVDKNVSFRINAPHEELVGHLASSLVGLHCMWNEHFGIGVVEYMASGAIAVAHRSGGPLMDIVTGANTPNGTGFLAETADEFASAILNVIDMGDGQRAAMQRRAREHVTRHFSERSFEEGWLAACAKIVPSQQ